MISQNSNQTLADRDIWSSFKSGDLDAFNLMFDKYSDTLFDYGRNLCTDSQLIQDCIQDTFIEIWSKKERLGQTDSIKFYLFKSLRRKVYRRLRRESKVCVSDTIKQDLSSHLELSPEGVMIAGESSVLTKKILGEAVEGLSDRQKEAIYLRFYRELSFREVSMIMGIKIKSTYRIVSQAVGKLQATIVAEKLCF